MRMLVKASATYSQQHSRRSRPLIDSGQRVHRPTVSLSPTPRQKKPGRGRVFDQDERTQSSSSIQPPICFQLLTMPQNSSAVFSVS